jgi:acetylornithine aminotransferase
MGELIKSKLSALPHVREVRGLGLLLGLHLDVPGKDVQAAMLERGIILGISANPNVLRLMPPLMVTEADVAHLYSALSEVLAGI